MAGPGGRPNRILMSAMCARRRLALPSTADARVIAAADAASLRAGREIAVARSVAAECAGDARRSRTAISWQSLAALSMPARWRRWSRTRPISSRWRSSFWACPMSGAARRSQGLDCSGLIQTALAGRRHRRAARHRHDGKGAGPCRCARESPARRSGFWKGHMGVMRDSETLLHANAFHMQVTSEPLAVAIARIDQAGDGDQAALIALRQIHHIFQRLAAFAARSRNRRHRPAPPRDR